MATGGSTNAVLHFLAVRLKPSGRFVAMDFHRAGGVPQVLKDPDRINGDCITITGRTIAEELSDGH
jgi:dihydroxy-acid dehydratase